MIKGNRKDDRNNPFIIAKPGNYKQHSSNAKEIEVIRAKILR